ncbi:cytochrome b5-related protein-like [Agrilus planipennis]|uniref:Cytochrome b5-related protein n=1 Tax=Agrilus planipennis TaxID=224129 RepID=A0A7F5RCJ1_AGRPL|nr:cytochrome b5-related protein-like [Agrilus planipennis]
MAPKAQNIPLQSTLGMKYPTYRDLRLKNTDIWLEGKRIDDGAEGLWRIHDDLYDLNDFIDKHPGGAFWLKMTKGTDITEAFEVHHISDSPEKLLPKYWKRKAKTSRNSPFSFKDDGFYRTLKRKVRPLLKDLPKRDSRWSNFYSDIMAFGLFLFGVLATRYIDFYFATICGILMALVTIAGHNYMHRKDNWRMYYPDLSLLQSREFRMFHIFSHHLYTNTIADLEISLHEPIMEFLPKRKSFVHRYLSIIYAPFYWLTLNHIGVIKRILIFLVLKRTSHFGFHDLVSFFPLLVMYVLGEQPFWIAFKMWFTATLVASLYFNLIGFTAAHHHPKIFHDGDKPRPEIPFDWGLGQLDAVMDRFEIDGSHFLILTNFGNHALHHFFPTLDHGQLKYLEPVFQETLKEFNIKLRKTTIPTLMLGMFKQITNADPNSDPPELYLKSQKRN